MIEFANPALLGALAAAGAPLLAHLAARRRLPRQDWAAMRFLAQVLARHRRRLALQHWLLMALRMLALACLALALARPRLAAPDTPGDGLRPAGAAVAAVLCLDDSPSAVAEGAWERMRALAHRYLDTLRPGDEVALVLGSQAEAPPADPLYDLAAVHARLDALRPADAASDIPALLAAGRRQLARHLNPHPELVLVSDGRADGWPAADDARWAPARPRPGTGPGGDPPVLLLAPAAGAVEDLAVVALEADRDPVPAGRPVGLRVRVANPGARAVAGAAVRLAVDGRVVAERPLEVPAGGEVQVTMRAQFAPAGAHVVEAALAGLRDAMPADDRRTLALEAVAALPVLLVSDAGGEGLGGALGLVAAALDPGGDGGSFFALRRATPAELGDQPGLAAAHRVVVVGGVRGLDARALAALARALAGGSGLLVCAGPELPAAASGPWWQGGDGVIAAPPGPRRDCAGRRIARLDSAHPALAAFLGGDLAAAFPGGEVRACWTLPRAGQGGAPADLAVLAELDDGAPLCVLRRRGPARSALIACALDGGDGELPLRPAFVPFIRGLAAWLGAALVPPRNLEAGDALAWLPPDGRSPDAQAATLEGPDGALPLAVGAWEGRAALVSPPLLRAGAYVLRPGSGPAVRYAVCTAPAESRLRPLAPAAAAAALAPARVLAVQDPARLAALAAGGGAPSARELWRVLVVAALALLALELAWSRTLARRETGDGHS